jgi:threonine aldolase
MWRAMRAARPEDLPRLEARAAELLGKEAAVWAPTCTAANLAALLTLARPGDRVALMPDAHILTTEELGIEQIARLRPVPLGDGEPALVCLENTHTRSGGAVLDAAETARLAASAPRAHLDGARLPNAAAALGVALAALAGPVDTVALSLNKCLGAPVGAVLAGSAEAIRVARVHLHRLGSGSLHQADLLAAAGLVALERVGQAAADNRRARELAERLAQIEGLLVEPPATNLIFLSVAARSSDELLERLAAEGVLGFRRDERRVRLALHGGIDDDAVEEAAAAVERAA